MDLVLDTVEVYVPFVDPGVSITADNFPHATQRVYLTNSQLSAYLHLSSNVDDSFWVPTK